MKKVVLLLVVLSIALSACSAPAGDGTFDWPDTPQVEQKNDSLTIFCVDDMKDGQMIKLAVQLYQEQYPEVNIELQAPEFTSGAERAELYEQVAAEAMAGTGPDVFIVDDGSMDVEKMVRQGVFADMEPFFTEDEFSWEPYHQVVMDGGVWDGRRYVIPLSYDFPLLVTSRTALEETGFSVEACVDFSGFMQETMRLMDDAAQTRLLFDGLSGITAYFLDFAGFQVADYNARTIDLTAPELEESFRWCKTAIEMHTEEAFNASYISLRGAGDIRDGKVLWNVASTSALSNFYHEYSAVKTIDEAVMMPIRDLEGNIRARIRYPVAVRGNSENLQNAYNFIKIILSEEVQSTGSTDELSVLNHVNYARYQEVSQGLAYHILAGTNGFYSTVNETEAIDWPTETEFDAFMAYVQEISCAYFRSPWSWRLTSAMRPFIYDGADYGETLKDAQRKLEIYITE